MTYQEQISALIQSVEKTKRKARPRYRKSEAIRDLEKVYHNHKLKTSPLPLYAVPRTTFEDRTSNGLTACILAYLKLRGAFASRLNTTGIYRNDIKKFVPNTQRRGLADITATYKGASLQIEVKMGRDRMSDKQLKVKTEFEASGGHYFIAKDFEDFKKWFDELL